MLIQRRVRIWLTLRHRQSAARVIQCWWRGVAQRRTYLYTLDSIRLIQLWWRRCLILRKQQQEIAAITIQRAWRGYVARCQAERACVAAVVIIQRCWRQYRSRRRAAEVRQMLIC